MIKIDKVTIHDYTILVDGNSGEEQLVISSSMGQGGYAKFLVHRIGVDMGGERIIVGSLIHNNHLMDEIQSQITEWCYGGIAPLPKEAAKLMDQIAKACKKIKRAYQID